MADMAIEMLFGLKSRGNIEGDLKLAGYRLQERLLRELRTISDAYGISQAKLLAIALDEFIYIAKKNAPKHVKERLNRKKK